MNRLRSILLFCAILSLLAGCHRINEDPAPLTGVGPGAYSQQDAKTQALEGAWYGSFADAPLRGLIGLSLRNNMDVRQALARLEQARALRGAARAGFMPSVDLEADSEKRWLEDDAQEGSSSFGGALHWEIDAFGRLRAAATSRDFEERAAADDIEAVRLSLSAEVAQTWYSAVAQQLTLKLLREQTKTDNKLLSLVNQRFAAGIGTNVEVLQQKSQLADNESLIPPAEASLRVLENRLDILAGAVPDGANRTDGRSEYPSVHDLPPLGIPSDLLLNRPDLHARKNLLIAQDAEIGAAIAERLPRITLSGSRFYADGSAGAADYATTLLGGIVQPLLDWGRRRAEVERNRALYQEQLAAFTQAYLVAVGEVENAIYQEGRQREFIKRLEARRDLLGQTLSAAEATYRQGESDYLPVLDAVQNLRGVERALVTQRLNLVLYRIQLFRALGAPVPTEEAKS